MPTPASKSKGISSWPEEERPRERLLSCGPQALTDAELVAILSRYQFNMLTPKDYNKFFNELRKAKLAGFTSAIDVAIRKGDGEKE